MNLVLFCLVTTRKSYPKWLKGVLHTHLAGINRQKWHNEINVNSHCESYKMLRDKLRCEPYNYNVIKHKTTYNIV